MDDIKSSGPQGSGDANEGSSFPDLHYPVEPEVGPVPPDVDIASYRRIVPASGNDISRQNAGFIRAEPFSRYFKLGRVLTVPASEPIDQYMDYVSQITGSRLGGNLVQRERKLIIIDVKATYCYAVPIVTYEGRGVSKAGVKKSDHAIVYTGKQPPSLMPSELADRDEAPVRPTAIRVKAIDPREKLSKAARINFGKRYKIEQSIAVRQWGWVSTQSTSALFSQFRSVVLETTPALSIIPTPGSDSSTIRAGQDMAGDGTS